MKQGNPTKQDFLNIFDESKKVTGVSRVLLDFRLVDPKNNDVVEWLQKASPCMGHSWFDWPRYREQMEDFKKRGVKAVQAILETLIQKLEAKETEVMPIEEVEKW